MKLPLGIVLLSVCVCIATAQEGWYKQNRNQHPQHLRGVQLLDSELGFAVGDSGTILRTDDGGETWIAQQSGTKNNLLCLEFVDKLVGCAVGANGTILNTDDGGIIWNNPHPGPLPVFPQPHLRLHHYPLLCGKGRKGAD